MDSKTAPVKNSFKPFSASAEIVANRHLGGASWLLQANLPEIAPAIVPGQFFMLRAAKGWRPLLARPFSLAGLGENRRTLSFLIDRVGEGTEDLTSLETGAEVRLWGPLGTGFPHVEEALLVAGGTGLAPFLRWLEEGRGTLFFGGRSAREVGKAALLKGGEKALIATDDGSAGFHGTVVDLLAAHLEQEEVPVSAPIFVCGPEPMMAAAARLAAEQGRTCLVSLETFMGCGIGICSGCAVKVKAGVFGDAEMVLTCRQGAVFDAEHILWEPGA